MTMVTLLTRSYFKTTSQVQSLRWIEEANPQNSLLLLWLSPSIRLDLEPDKRF